MKQLNTIISSLKSRQMSEAIINAVFLTLSGGFQDAYTYCCREEVFANAQTGNIVLMSSYIFQGNFYTKEKSVLRKSLYYFCVLLTFAAGAGLGGMLTKIYGIHAIWFSCLLLIISFCIMFIKEEVEKI